MATGTYAPIASITLGSSASSVEFSSIPQYYRDLVLMVDGQGISVNAGNVYIYFSGDNLDSNYSRVYMYGTGSSALSGSNNEPIFAYIQNGVQSSSRVNIFDYSATDKHKTVTSVNARTNDFILALAGRWADTSAVTSMEINPDSGSFATGTTLALYGIEA